MKPIILAPSILAANFTCLAGDIKELETVGASHLHIDIMDGQFVPNISFGALMVEACASCSKLFRDVHLMIDKPERFIKDFAQAGANMLTFHAEATVHTHRVIEQIKENGVQAGLAVNPLTPLAVIKEALPYLDLVLIMSVNPGFGGQKFIAGTLERLSKVQRWQEDLGLEFDIQVDGGIDDKTIASAVKAGANNLVAGSTIFKTKDSIGARFKHLSQLAKEVL